MTCRQTDPLRLLTVQERHERERLRGVVLSLIWTYDDHDYWSERVSPAPD
jgi:hypothetical protein